MKVVEASRCRLCGSTLRTVAIASSKMRVTCKRLLREDSIKPHEKADSGEQCII